MKDKIELKEGYEFLQMLVDEGIFDFEYREDLGGYYNANEDWVINKNSNIMLFRCHDMISEPYLVSDYIAGRLFFNMKEKAEKITLQSRLEMLKMDYEKVITNEIENDERFILTAFNSDDKKETKATRVTLFKEESKNYLKVVKLNGKKVIDSFISNFIQAGKKCKIELKSVTGKKIGCKYSSGDMELTITFNYQLIDE